MIRLLLGYTDDLPDPVLSAARQNLVDTILPQLEAIDTQLAQALPDSMALQVGDLQVDYAQHMALLRSQGSRLLRQLANVAGLQVQYDPYTGKSAGQSSPTLQIKSYY